MAMDRDHQAILARMAPPADILEARLMMRYASGTGYDEVSDPCYGGRGGFELALDLLEQASRDLLESLLRALRSG